MGLDDFSEDDNASEDICTDDSADNSTDTDSDVGDEKDELSGLESFNTTPDRGGSTQNNGSDNQNNEVFGIQASKWSNMTKKERIAAVRDSEIPDFKPQEQLDERWSYVEMVAVKCVCGEIITFVSSGVCSSCNREYSRQNRTVKKESDPEGVIIHNNAKDN